jgi:hypothetical protein
MKTAAHQALRPVDRFDPGLALVRARNGWVRAKQRVDPMSIKLTDTELVIMSAAARRDDRCLEVPKSLKPARAAKVAAKLLAAGLVREVKAKTGIAVWRRDENAGQAYSLKLTAAGLKAIAVEESDAPSDAGADSANAGEKDSRNTAHAGKAADAAMGANVKTDTSVTAAVASATPIDGAASTATTETTAASPVAPREGTKIARVLFLLHRDQGATLDELIVATGWLPHTARAALTGLRHRGYDVRLRRDDNDRAPAYRVVAVGAMAS